MTMVTTFKPAVFRTKYGPWAVITGASDGTGAAFARQLASLGLNLVLIARRPDPLADLAAELEQAHDIETRTATIDLYQPDAGQRVLEAAAGLEVGLFISNAGADTNGLPFLDAPLDAWRKLITRNVLVVTETVYGFAGPMRERRRGGILLMSSGTALGGAPGVAVYSGTKAFDLNLAESLWVELGDFGIDVLSSVSPAMNTPSLQHVLAKHNLSVPGLFEAEDVVQTLLARLPDGPTHVFAFGPDAPQAGQIEKARRVRVEMMREASKMFFGDHK
ncbi:SDR family NAD(P)-dependent oxidoreductase [Pseudomonas sp. LB3P14]